MAGVYLFIYYLNTLNRPHACAVRSLSVTRGRASSRPSVLTALSVSLSGLSSLQLLCLLGPTGRPRPTARPPYYLLVLHRTFNSVYRVICIGTRNKTDSQSSSSSLSSKSMTVALDLELPDCPEQLPAAGRPPPTGTAGSGPGSEAGACGACGACPAASRPPRLGAIAKSSSSLSPSLGSRRCCLVGLALGAALAAFGAAAALRLGAWLRFRAWVSGQVQGQGPGPGPGPGPGQGPVLSGAC